jgi:hypothetical protein
MKAYDKVLAAAESDDTIFTERGKEMETFGHNPQFLLDAHGITKSDLIRLERLGLAKKARYVTRNKSGRWQFKDAEGEKIMYDGPHRVRWILFRREAA